MTAIAAQAQDLTLTVRSGLLERRTVLDDISFTLPAGAVMGLVGRNGAGKSSLLRCLVGLAVPQAGRWPGLDAGGAGCPWSWASSPLPS